jgi:hypothetical protein
MQLENVMAMQHIALPEENTLRTLLHLTVCMLIAINVLVFAAFLQSRVTE